MKPVISRTFLIQNLFIALAVLFAVIAVVFSAKIITFVPSSFGSVADGDVQIPLYVGIVPLSSLAHFLGFVFVYLMFEFYGFKPAFYTAINQGVAALMCLAVLYLIAHYTLDVQASSSDELLAQFLVYDRKSSVILILSFVAGNGTTIFLASILKRIMRNYFMFIRFPISSAAGFAVTVAISIYLTNLNTLAPRSLLLTAITPAAQYLVMILVTVIPLYLLRLVFGLFRGWSKAEDTRPPPSKSLFKSSEPLIVPESQAEVTSDGLLPPP